MPELSLYDDIFFRLSQIEEFKNLSMDMQGEICIAVKHSIEGHISFLHKNQTLTDRMKNLLEGVSQGIWTSRESVLGTFRQCSFCCVAPENEHNLDCPVRVAREIIENTINKKTKKLP